MSTHLQSSGAGSVQREMSHHPEPPSNNPLLLKTAPFANPSVEELLQSHLFLSGLNPEFCRFLSDIASLRRFASHQEIFREGTEADHFYLIVKGQVALETLVPGRGMLTIQTLGPNEALGWSWLFPPHRWRFTARTVEPTEVISLAATALRDKAQVDPDFRHELLTRVIKTLLDRLLHTRMDLIDLYGMRP